MDLWLYKAVLKTIFLASGDTLPTCCLHPQKDHFLSISLYPPNECTAHLIPIYLILIPATLLLIQSYFCG